RLCGDVISPPPPAGRLSIDYRISDADEPNAEYELQVFRDEVGGGVASMVTSVTLRPGGGTGQVADVAFSGEPQFFFFKLKQFDEDGREDAAWTAPVWFERPAPASLAITEDAAFPKMVRAGNDARARAASAAAGLGDQIPDLDTLAAAARLAFESAPPADPAGFVATRESNVFHVSPDCLDAAAIASGAMVRGVEARLGREAHQGCPRLAR
ncbi:MAG: hypothetical protein K2X91_05555, partial [Thermoleophilia bacterium]|nr:hypothetical protein [Thermoleophilia bacterium]